MRDAGFSTKNLSRSVVPRLPYERIKDRVLGKDFELSLVFVGPTISRRLNKSRRGKNKPTNVLSFLLSETSGEIFIDLMIARKEAPFFDKSFKNFAGQLFIHALFHLKGLRHGSTMEKEEEKIRKIFHI